MPGWKTPTGGARSFGDLPGAARDYLRRIESLTGVPVRLLSLGPRRDQTFAMARQ
jgi:adenylosuccinate synthase